MERGQRLFGDSGSLPSILVLHEWKGKTRIK